MAGISDLIIVMGGLLLTLGIGGVVGNLVCQIPRVRRQFNIFYKRIPLGREEVQELSKKRHSCKRQVGLMLTPSRAKKN